MRRDRRRSGEVLLAERYEPGELRLFNLRELADGVEQELLALLPDLKEWIEE